jgi:hypothetical protein
MNAFKIFIFKTQNPFSHEKSRHHTLLQFYLDSVEAD